MTYTLDDFHVDGHRHDCEAGRVASQTDEVPNCSCAGLLRDLAQRMSEMGAEDFPAERWTPPHLDALVTSITYKTGWTFDLTWDEEDETGHPGFLRLHIVSLTTDSYDRETLVRINHAFIVPLATYSRDTWAAWLFDRVRDVETHEAGEFFMLDGYREFAPHHGNGEDPYRVWHVGDHAAARKKAGQD